FAAAVLDAQGWFLQNDAALRIGEHDAPSFSALHELSVVEDRIEAEQALLEAAAAVLGAVASALIAARLGQNRHDLAAEADRKVGAGAGNFDRHGDRLAAGSDGQGRRAVADRTH